MDVARTCVDHIRLMVRFWWWKPLAQTISDSLITCWPLERREFLLFVRNRIDDDDGVCWKILQIGPERKLHVSLEIVIRVILVYICAFLLV